jgi:CrcB protein
MMTPDRATVGVSFRHNPYKSDSWKGPWKTWVPAFGPALLAIQWLDCGSRHYACASVLQGKVNSVGKFFIVGIGGFVGSVLRFWLGAYIGQRMGTRFPYGTFLINVTGSFLIGFVMTVLSEKANLSPNWRYLIPIGFIGGYTTFSTFEYETLRAVQDGQFTTGMLNIVLSVVVGFVMVWTGAMLGRAVA